MNPKALNALAARVARIEALMENKDAFGPQGNTTYGGLQYEGSTFNIAAPEGMGQDEQMAQNNGFDANAFTIFELQQRISELEMLVAGGSNDTNQGGALDSGAAVGDDASDGSGSASGIPAGYGPVEISICDGSTTRTMTVLGTTPV
jgi:hypothetical protein